MLGGCDTGADHARLPVAGAARDPRGRSGVAGRRLRRGRAARLVLPDRARTRGRAFARIDRIPGNLDRHLCVPGGPRGASRGGHGGVGASRTTSIKRVVFCCFSAQSARHHLDAAAELGLACPIAVSGFPRALARLNSPWRKNTQIGERNGQEPESHHHLRGHRLDPHAVDVAAHSDHGKRDRGRRDRRGGSRRRDRAPARATRDGRPDQSPGRSRRSSR